MYVPLSSQTPYSHAHRVVSGYLCDELDNTASLLDLLLSLGRDVAGADDDGDLRKAALSENLGVAEVEDVEDGGLVTLLGEVGVALLSGDERPELVEVDGGLPEAVLHLVDCAVLEMDFVVVRCGVHTVSHSDLSKVTGMVLVNVGPVVVLTTGHTTTTGMLPLCGCQLLFLMRSRRGWTNVLSDTTVTGGDVTAVLAGLGQSAR